MNDLVPVQFIIFIEHIFELESSLSQIKRVRRIIIIYVNSSGKLNGEKADRLLFKGYHEGSQRTFSTAPSKTQMSVILSATK